MQKSEEYRALLDKLEVALEEVVPACVQADWMCELLLKPAQEMALDLQAILLPARDLIKRGELPHNGSLIIDDIEDKSDTRRGQPAIHKIYGEDVAINTGNFLYFLPTYILEKVILPAPLKERLIFSWLAVMRRLHIGQGLDIGWHNNPLYLPSIQEYSDMCRWKTGCLAGLAAQWGALLGGLTDEHAKELGEIWQKIGIAFQILDDTSNLKQGNAGKKRGDDLLEGKKSYPLLVYALNNNPVPLLEDIKKLKEMRNSNEQDLMIESIISRLNEKGCLQTAYEDGKKLLEECKRELLATLPNTQALDLLLGLLDNFIS
ncbi:UNVERIFIED_CONTAM: hypothetical protein PYX00_010916 [Menopon gallinae]|uniref:Geranylgeranyl diphosphate synthase n=1 Tax=Menopon gallinae TaxID=328185 RepID=A0AAW2H6X7_9NEOP